MARNSKLRSANVVPLTPVAQNGYPRRKTSMTQVVRPGDADWTPAANAARGIPMDATTLIAQSPFSSIGWAGFTMPMINPAEISVHD